MKANRIRIAKGATPVSRRAVKASALTLSFLPLLDRSNAVKQVQIGFPIAAIEALADGLQITQQSLLRIAHIAPATLARRRRHPDERLSSEESDRLYRIGSTCDLALRLFEGDAVAARRWLKEPAKALAGVTPFEHLATEAGAAQVREVIGRLESGVYL